MYPVAATPLGQSRRLFVRLLTLFQDEYHVPVLSPDVAAVLGTGGELALRVLLVLGVGGRYLAVVAGRWTVGWRTAGQHWPVQTVFERGYHHR